MSQNLNEVRIIGGKWRGKKIHFPPEEGLRPTPDRVRETLFNWLSHHIYDSRCLDLFAGSGALGFEALSRGAREVTFVDNSPEVITHIQKTLKSLDTTKGTALKQNIVEGLKFINPEYDIIFLDPPYHKNLIQPICEKIHKEQYLKEGGLLYIEAEKTLHPLPIPSSWEILREKQAGIVGYYLIRTSCHPRASEDPS